MATEITADNQLGPRVKPPFAVRFGIWLVLAILGATAAIGSLISYSDQTRVLVQFLAALPIRADGGGGRIQFRVSEGQVIGDHAIIAQVQPRSAGVAVARARIPAPFSASIKAGDLLNCEIQDSHGIERRIARVDAVLAADKDAVDVRLVVPGKPTKGVLHIVGPENSVLHRLVIGLLKK
jgi:hypothetical protein